MKKINNNEIIAVILSALVLTFFLFFIALPRKEFSENENRYLAKPPEFTIKNLLEGNYMEGLEALSTDHFPLRDEFIGIKTGFQKLAGMGETEGIYLLKDEKGPYLMEGYKEPVNTQRIGRILGGFRETLEKGGYKGGVYLALVPTAVGIYADTLPAAAPDAPGGYRENAGITQENTAAKIYEISGFDDIYAKDELSAHKDRDIYFRTDHHWTTEGAYYGTLPFLREAGVEPEELSRWEFLEKVPDFTGTLWSKAGDYSIPGEDIELYHHPGDSIRAYYPDEELWMEGLYNLEYGDKKDKYALFLNGLHPLVEIYNQEAVTDRKLILIKDSYANAALPFLSRYFREIHVFDTRYYRKPVSEYVLERPDFTDVLILYNMNTLDSDQGVRSIS